MTNSEPVGKFFVLRLLAPRPTFPMDMTADERVVMEQHVGYWRDLLKNGTAYVFGPVADPKGVWGLGVVRAADAAAVQELQSADPVIRAGLGFSYEILPMLQAVVRE
ncbi:MAG TPA: YciI family protein [Polyangiaceae bacterium]|nr:YciI family protein [Polyangiaceae bacterium]